MINNTLPFKGIFQDPENGKENINAVIKEIVTEENLQPLLTYLNNHRDFSLLNINYSQLSTKMRISIEKLIHDLEDFSSFLELTRTTPIELKKDFNTFKTHIESINRLFKANPMMSLMIDSLNS